MNFSEVIGQQHIKSHLIKGVETGRIPHAQIFSGAVGFGLLPTAIAYAGALLCKHLPENQKKDCLSKVKKLEHPDLHFIYPVNTTEKIKKNAVSTDFIEEWREFVKTNPYGTLFQWLQSLGIENKQGNISAAEAEIMTKKLSLKSYSGGYKVMIIWMAETLNTACANKILKLIEEPSERTVIILLTEREERILTTIRSRCQAISFPRLSENDISEKLIKDYNLRASDAHRIATQSYGDFNRAIHLASNSEEDAMFENWFISWMRIAFMARKDREAINKLIDWSEEIADQGTEIQKRFLFFCTEIFRQALLKNYTVDNLVYFKAMDKSFKIENFAPYIHHNNILKLYEQFEESYYHISRNANAKILFVDLSIKMVHLLLQKNE